MVVQMKVTRISVKYVCFIQNMDMNILLTILGGGNLILFIKFLIERYDKKKEREEENEQNLIKSTLKKLEKDGIRTQLLLLVLLLPEEKKEILTLGEYYFKKPPEGLDGNWYMTSIFNGWLEKTDTAKPEWFKG